MYPLNSIDGNSILLTMHGIKYVSIQLGGSKAVSIEVLNAGYNKVCLCQILSFDFI